MRPASHSTIPVAIGCESGWGSIVTLSTMLIRSLCCPWRSKLLRELPNVELTIVLGQYAQAWHLPADKATTSGKTLTDTVLAWREFIPRQVPMPHPSPRNNLWLRRNAWFETDVIPWLQERVKRLLRSG